MVKECVRQRCHTRAAVFDLCRKHAVCEADRLCGDLVRARGICESDGDGIRHGGPLQWCHGFTRSRQNTRWDLANGFCMCAGHHKFYTHNPDRWERWMKERLGENFYFVLQARSFQTTKVDLERVLTELRGLVA